MCPDCKESCECFVREIREGVSFYDEYTRHCKKCGHITKERKEKGSTYLGVHETECPFCDKKAKDHLRTPKELLPNPATS